MHVICYLRRQDLWIESDFKQHIKGRSPWTDDLYALIDRRKKARTIDYHWMVSHWAGFVGREKVSVIPLNKTESPDYPMRRFMEVLGIQCAPAQLFQAPARNVSPPAGLIESARHVKRACLDQGFSVETTEDVVRKFIERAQATITVPDRNNLLTTNERLDLVNYYADSNKRLADEFLDQVPAFDSVEIRHDPDKTFEEDSDEVLARYAISHTLAHQEPRLPVISRALKSSFRAISTSVRKT